MENLQTTAELKNCKIENPSRLFWLLAKYVGRNKQWVLSPCVTIALQSYTSDSFMGKTKYDQHSFIKNSLRHLSTQ